MSINVHGQSYMNNNLRPKLVDGENDPAGLVSALKNKYDLYTVNSNDPVFVPIYSAEFHPEIVQKLLKNN